MDDRMDDPEVLAMWRDWLRIRRTAVMTGWTFAAYVAARHRLEAPKFFVPDTAHTPWTGAGGYQGRL